MHLGYNTNGLAHHSLPAAIELLAGLGYRSVAITLDHSSLNPFDQQYPRNAQEMAMLLASHGMRSVIETGARYLLDPCAKHEPTLISRTPAGRARRVEFLCRAIDAAADLQSDCVSLWSGAVQEDHEIVGSEAFELLVQGLLPVVDYADRRGVTIGFEPEPGMLIDTMAAYERLLGRIDSPRFQLTLDVGHLHCLGEGPIADVIRRWQDRLVNVHIEDMRRGEHAHLMFGEGEMDFPPIVAALAEIGYDGGVHVELSRHSHVGPAAAAQAFAFLQPLMLAANATSRDDLPRINDA